MIKEIASLTAAQIKNMICGYHVSERGFELYRYYCRVFNEGVELQTYAEQMYEEDLNEMLPVDEGFSREDKAGYMALILAKHMTPWEYWKEPYQVL